VVAQTAGGTRPGVSQFEVQDLHVWFDLSRTSRELHAVRGVSFGLDTGERFGLVGESGCGKTTTILALMGLLPSTAYVSGRLLLAGEDILAGGNRSMRPHRWRDIAMVFQGAMNALNPVRPVIDQIVEPIEFHSVASGKKAKLIGRDLLDRVGIPAATGERNPQQFSGGMRQRAAIAMALACTQKVLLADEPTAAIAMALACSPKVLLADEPTTALDVMVQAQILELLIELSDEFGLALSEALERAGLLPAELYADRYPHELSGGQRQRVAIAAALVLNPELSLADEPLSMLDVSVRAGLLSLLDGLRRDGNMGVLMITHDLSTAAHFADRIAVMYLGRIVEHGSASDVVRSPQHPYTRALLSVVPRRDPRERSKAHVLKGETPNPIDIPVGCRFAPRCPMAEDRCREVDPQLHQAVGPAAADHEVACIRA
jgi:oligopeptide/dipeptide ABC transporter ATP-binding protein